MVLEFKKQNHFPDGVNQLNKLEIINHENANKLAGPLSLEFQCQLQELIVNNSTSLNSLSFLAALPNLEMLKILVLDHCIHLDLLEKMHLLKKSVKIDAAQFANIPKFGFKGTKFYKNIQNSENASENILPSNALLKNGNVEDNSSKPKEEDGQLITEEDFEGEKKDSVYMTNQYIFFNYILLVPQMVSSVFVNYCCHNYFLFFAIIFFFKQSKLTHLERIKVFESYPIQGGRCAIYGNPL